MTLESRATCHMQNAEYRAAVESSRSQEYHQETYNNNNMHHIGATTTTTTNQGNASHASSIVILSRISSRKRIPQRRPEGINLNKVPRSTESWRIAPVQHCIHLEKRAESSGEHREGSADTTTVVLDTRILHTSSIWKGGMNRAASTRFLKRMAQVCGST